jgi:hypothetical protein
MTGDVLQFPEIHTEARRAPDEPPCEVVVLPVVRIERRPEQPKFKRGRRSLLRDEDAS